MQAPAILLCLALSSLALAAPQPSDADTVAETGAADGSGQSLPRLSARVAANPDDILARAALGRAYLDAGRAEDARAQLTEIRRRGGRGSWAEFLLRSAIERGPVPGY